MRELELEQPVSLRHILDLKSDREPIADSDPGVGLHSYPIVISSMSFGSQGEVAYRSYAEAAMRANIIAMNGEGGEIQDMYGRYPKWRGQQVASGRFGVTSEMVNSSFLVEIKIGQGAKPGEGGHLPAKKVTEKVAQARNASPGTDLISPSNNHDLYSIEDLAELIDELKTANPDVRVSVKVPVVPNIGTIGVGIAKAGADIITLSGFEGGTGAARSHALRHVGLPSDIGTRAVHLALMEAGIRNRVEIWADGGYRHGWDIVKLHCLGANRVGFGTLAMVSLGCTICRGCQLDTCHVGIATQIETKIEADMKGLKKFTPQEFELASENCTRFFTAMGEEVRAICAELGYERAQDLVGRSDLLVQSRAVHDVDVLEMIKPLEEFLDLEPIDLPAPEEERSAPGLVVARPIRMRPKEASHQLAALATDVCAGTLVRRSYPRPADAGDRVLGTELAGELARARIFHPDTAPAASEDTLAHLHFDGGSVAGQGLGAFNVYGVDITVEGGAQDGVAKTMLGGKISIMKGKNRFGKRVNGSVGKSFAYGAQRGRLFVQGNADSRFCIRLSGADVVHWRGARGTAGGRAGLRGGPREHQGLRVRVHDQRPRRGARRSGPLVLRGPDRRARVPACERGLGSHPRGADQATRQGREGGSGGSRRRGRPRRAGAARPLRGGAPRHRPARRGAAHPGPRRRARAALHHEHSAEGADRPVCFDGVASWQLAVSSGPVGRRVTHRTLVCLLQTANCNCQPDDPHRAPPPDCSSPHGRRPLDARARHCRRVRPAGSAFLRAPISPVSGCGSRSRRCGRAPTRRLG